MALVLYYGILYAMWLRHFVYESSQNIFQFQIDKFNFGFRLLNNNIRHAQITIFFEQNNWNSLENSVKIDKIVGALNAFLTIVYRKENQKNEPNVCYN